MDNRRIVIVNVVKIIQKLQAWPTWWIKTAVSELFGFLNSRHFCHNEDVQYNHSSGLKLLLIWKYSNNLYYIFDRLNDPGQYIQHSGCLTFWKLWNRMKCGLFGITIRVTVTWFLLYGFTIILRYLIADHYTPECQLTSDSKSYNSPPIAKIIFRLFGLHAYLAP